MKSGRLDAQIRPGETRDDMTMDKLIDRGAFFCGDAASVYEQCKNFWEETGGFGVFLLMAGKDWGTNEQRARSMREFMTVVAPRLQKLDTLAKAA